MCVRAYKVLRCTFLGTINLRGRMLEYIKFGKRNFVSIPNNITKILHNISCNVF